MALNLPRKVKDFLAGHPSQKFSAREIAQEMLKKFPGECQNKKNNSKVLKTDADLITQIVSEIGGIRPRLQKRWPEFRTIEGPPRLYYWETKVDQDEIAEVDEVDPNVKEASAGLKPKELDLYPILSTYLWSAHNIHPLRIDERKSSNTKGAGGNSWLYPDLVGLENLQAEWHKEVQFAAKAYLGKRIKLWSFEVKTTLKRSNVRQAFFQAVSNSSWANVGYLVTNTIAEEDGSLKELRMLASLHGIGLIKLNPQNPAASQIMIPARERPDVDWATCDRLTRENKDFYKFTKLIRQFYQTDDLHRRDWDLP